MRENWLKKTAILLVMAASFSCVQGEVDPVDRQTGLSYEESKYGILEDKRKNKRKSNKKSLKSSSIPEISTLSIEPPQPIFDKEILNSKKTISFSVTDQIPLKDVLIELGRAAKIDVDIDPQISGGIVISAYNRPLGEIVDRIAKLGNLRYSYKNHVLHFKRDLPYLKNYFVDYLIEGNNLWGEVETNLNSILSESSNNSSQTPATITSNRTAGIMSIFANDSQHKKIERYLKDVEKSASSQVLIEAKVVEVKLNDDYRTGIDWNYLGVNSSGKTTDLDISSNFSTPNNISATPFQFLFSASDLSLTISALEQFGITRTLSSPRIHSINNKRAVLNFTDKLVYFQIENTAVNQGGGVGNSLLAETLTSTRVEEDVGVELTIIPSINIKTNEVTLDIKPKITIQSGEVVDPASPVVNGQVIQNVVPVIQTREIDTIAKLQSGNVIVIGGLMRENTVNVDTGVPFLQNIPLIGNLFKSTSKEAEIVETVIFIKATIVDSATQADEVDRDIQEKYDSSRRKFF